MKKFLVLTFSVTLFLCAYNITGANPKGNSFTAKNAVYNITSIKNIDISGLTKWMEGNIALRNCIANGAWSNDPDDAPTDAELATMFKMALMPGSAHGLTPAHFIVIRDYEEQKSLLNAMNGMVSKGTVTVLILADTLRDQEHHAEPYSNWYQQMYYGIFDAGISSGYLNLAAISMGYGTHFYAMISLPVDGTISLDNGGKFSLIQGNNWDISKYTTSKDGTTHFTHTIGAYGRGRGPRTKTIQAEGNLTLLATVVIGKAAREGIDAISAATTQTRAENFNFWDPQDSVSFGNADPEVIK